MPYTADPMIPPKMNPAPIKSETSLMLYASAITSTAVPSALKTPNVIPKIVTKRT